jgi:hypothetical protein
MLEPSRVARALELTQARADVAAKLICARRQHDKYRRSA